MTARGPTGESSDPLNRLLDEAIQAEREAPPLDPELFLAGVRDRIASSRVPPRPGSRWFQIAAAILFAIILGFVATPSTMHDPADPAGSGDVDVAVIEQLDLLRELEGFDPQELQGIDPELVEILSNLELLRSSPLEILESSG